MRDLLLIKGVSRGLSRWRHAFGDKLRFSWACQGRDGVSRRYDSGMRKPNQQRRSHPHTRAIQRDRSKRPTLAPSAPAIEASLADLVQPAVYAQLAAFRAAGLRDRILALPVMVALVLSMIWRQIGSVREAVRVLAHEGFLWVQPTRVSQSALVQRLGTLPAPLFANVLHDLLPQLHQRAHARQRPLPPVVAHAQQHFAHVLALDGSTLDALLRKTGLLRDSATHTLAGRMAALVEVGTQVPQQVWYEDDSLAHDARFWDHLWSVLQPRTLLLFDQGFVNYAHFDTLTERGVGFIMASTRHQVWREQAVLADTAQVRDRLIRLGSRRDTCCQHLMRLVEVQVGSRWHRYLTNVLDPTVLTAAHIALLYAQRWRIEDAFNLVKRLLGLAYFWSGSSNGVQVQVWATWLLYAVLIDLTDAVAEGLAQPLQQVSLEMVYRGLYHYTQAAQRGEADDVIDYLVAHAKRLDLRKQQRKKRRSLEDRLALPSQSDA